MGRRRRAGAPLRVERLARVGDGGLERGDAPSQRRGIRRGVGGGVGGVGARAALVVELGARFGRGGDGALELHRCAERGRRCGASQAAPRRCGWAAQSLAQALRVRVAPVRQHARSR